ncbi:type 2A phosphatase activator TIP41 [Diplogelasinospora grovesii]|uniref:Type 2A phosphatase activator TIP41 n=1 Tax=Diplogelasinospora grovesii TaxID=303347 RepID=A0AAN6N9A4_9PEZI|nr:type 2A phosphatase activator TIP41 [Diplogelasinospora grovesii]
MNDPSSSSLHPPSPPPGNITPEMDDAQTLAEATTVVHRQGRFLISSRKLPISKSGPIDAMSCRLGIPVPEMIFGDNLISITHAPTGWSLSFTAEEALDLVDKTGEKGLLRVAYANSWSSSREKASATAGISEVVKPYDWSYTTSYRGTETPGSGSSKTQTSQTTNPYLNAQINQPTPTSNSDEEGRDDSGLRLAASTDQVQIPLELLRRRDPILFFDEVTLYESELDDNGISVLSVKVRVMEQRMLLLCRQYMRLDDVLVRVRDTRVYVDFQTDTVIREYTSKEDSFQNVKRALLMSGLREDAITVAMRDANQIAQLLPTVENVVESVSLKR